MIRIFYLSLWILLRSLPGSPPGAQPESKQAFKPQSTPLWHLNITEARQIAQKEHRHILLNFSGSDWCGPCILLKKEIFDDPAFSQLADSTLVLVNADFPRMKKNQLSKEQQQLNDQLADQYNGQGKFPLTLILTADGKVLKQWEGYPGVKPTEFSNQVRAVIDADQGQ